MDRSKEPENSNQLSPEACNLEVDQPAEQGVNPGNFDGVYAGCEPDHTGGYMTAFPPPGHMEDELYMSSFNFDLRRLMIGAWQRRYLGAAIALSMTALMFLIIHFGISKSWQSSATLIKRSHQDRLSLAERDPFKSQDYSLATLLDTLKLPSSLDHVRQQAGLDVSLTTLATSIDVSLGRDSKILNLKVTWSSAEKSAELANLLAHTFIDRTRLLLKDDATSAFDYYSAQLEETRQNARRAAADVLAFRQQHGISNLDAETRVLLEEMSRLQSELHSRRAEADALRVASTRLVSALEQEPEQVIIYTIYRNPFKSRLAETDKELREALSRYTEQNPKIIKLRQRIDVIKQMMATNSAEGVPENTYSRNTKREEMELRLQLLIDDVKLREAQAGALEDTMLDMKSKVTALSRQEKDYLLLQARLDGILALDNQLAQRVEETRLVKQRNDASFDIIEAAAVPTEPVSSGRKLMAVASLVFALGTGFALVLLIEWCDPMVRSARDVTEITGNGSCVEIPASLTVSDPLLDRSQPIGALANLYRSLCNDLDGGGGTHQNQHLGIISIDGGTGRSTVAANLAVSRLMKGQQVLLVDADLRQAAGTRPAEYIGLPAESSGLYEHLLDAQELHQRKDESGAMTYIGAAGDKLQDDRGLLALGSMNLADFLSPLQDEGYTIVDLPPLAGLEVALELAGQLSHVLLVVRSGYTRRDELKRCMAQLNKRGIHCGATLLLDIPIERLEGAKLFTLASTGKRFNFRNRAEYA